MQRRTERQDLQAKIFIVLLFGAVMLWLILAIAAT